MPAALLLIAAREGPVIPAALLLTTLAALSSSIAAEGVATRTLPAIGITSVDTRTVGCAIHDGIVRSVHLGHFLGCLLVAGIEIRVVFFGKLAICLGHLFLGGAGRHTEH